MKPPTRLQANDGFVDRFWNPSSATVVDDLLNRGIENCHTIAYADDAVEVVGVDNWRKLVRRLAVVTTMIEEWASDQKLSTSTYKAVYLMIKGNYQRDPTVKESSELTTTRYLGIFFVTSPKQKSAALLRSMHGQFRFDRSCPDRRRMFITLPVPRGKIHFGTNPGYRFSKLSWRACIYSQK